MLKKTTSDVNKTDPNGNTLLIKHFRLKDYIGRICFHPTTHMIFPGGSIMPVSSNI